MISGAKIALVLGGTSAHIALLENLKARKYFTILIDYYDNPPAKKYADEHLRESTLNEEAVLKIAKEREADLVISTSIDQANVTACYVGEKLNLPIPYSYETALKVTNKILMKNIMLENDIPTAKPFFWDIVENINEKELIFPLIVKPADSNGSLGVKKVNNTVQLMSAFKKAKEISRSNSVIVEELKKGIEISVDAFVQESSVEIIMIRQKYKLPEERGMVLQSPGSFSPAYVGTESFKKLKKIIEKICNSFNLKHTSLLVQAILSDDEINIIEFAPRIGGGMSYRTIFLNTGFDIVDATVNSYLQIKKQYEYTLPNSYILTIIVYAKKGIFSHIEGVPELICKSIILEFYQYKTKGMVIGDDMSTRSRIGAFLVKANSYEKAVENALVAIETLNVYNDKNESIMRKDIYKDIKIVNKVI